MNRVIFAIPDALWTIWDGDKVKLYTAEESGHSTFLKNKIVQFLFIINGLSLKNVTLFLQGELNKNLLALAKNYPGSVSLLLHISAKLTFLFIIPRPEGGATKKCNLSPTLKK